MSLYRNAIQTPDGTVLESRHLHDYKEYVDDNGKTYMVDGGLSYSRRSCHGDEINLALYDDDKNTIEEIREVMTWGTRGINGDQPLTYVKLKDMSTTHIARTLSNVPGILPHFIRSFYDELARRDAYINRLSNSESV